ncbi:hypothetical protein F2P81_008272 [Scophthalmus maximus]|uniref:Uncharacterized protein n=1 Tax=Scophthalmus maximus TaxID=52904 RepID=A0A6A4T1U2_SCOMX|nr:hypothetical protein F2P81_008272 [Scophthalmus maximus]
MRRDSLTELGHAYSERLSNTKHHPHWEVFNGGGIGVVDVCRKAYCVTPDLENVPLDDVCRLIVYAFDLRDRTRGDTTAKR